MGYSRRWVCRYALKVAMLLHGAVATSTPSTQPDRSTSMSLATAWYYSLVSTVQITVWETPLNYHETLILVRRLVLITHLIARAGAPYTRAACGAASTALKRCTRVQSSKKENIVLIGASMRQVLCHTAWDACPTRQPWPDCGAAMRHRSMSLRVTVDLRQIESNHSSCCIQCRLSAAARDGCVVRLTARGPS